MSRVKDRVSVVWLGFRGGDVSVFGDAAKPAGVICSDWNDTLARLANDVPVLTIEKDAGVRRCWGVPSVAEHPPAAIAALLNGAPDAVVVPYEWNPLLDGFLKQAVGEVPPLLAPPPETVARLQDKRAQRALFAKAGLPTPRCIFIGASDLAQAVDEIEFPCIVQHPIGSRGRDVHRADGPADIERLAGRWPDDDELLVSAFVPGPSFNVAAVVTRDRVHVAWPSLQIIGIPSCAGADVPFGFCGNDYVATSGLDAHTLETLFDLVERLGVALRNEGWLGIFGVDTVLGADGWTLLETNVRFQASSQLQTQLEQRAGVTPLAAAHVEAFLPGRVDALPPERPERPLCGSQILLYQVDASPRPVARRALDLPSGFTVDGAPMGGVVVHPAAFLARITTDDGVLDPTTGALRPDAEAAVEAARRYLDADALVG